MKRTEIKTEAMEDNMESVELLLEKVADLGTTTFELAKLKALEKTSDAVSSAVPNSIVLFLAVSFLLFFNVGLAFWLGEMLGKPFRGFFVIAAFYAITGLVVHFFMHKPLKKRISNYIIRLAFK